VLDQLWGRVATIEGAAPDDADIAMPLDALAGIAAALLVS
jgi:hypothetical protein